MSNRFVVLGTDTEVGKTTFSLLWLAAFGHEVDYWKPVETGDSDSSLVARLIPRCTVHPPAARYIEPASPVLAARLEGREPPTAACLNEVFRRVVQSLEQRTLPLPAQAGAAEPRSRGLVLETFGSPLSPLNDRELQIEFVRRLELPCVLVVDSMLGAIGRTLQCLHALARWDVRPRAIVLLGAADSHAIEQIARHSGHDCVVSLAVPAAFTSDAIGRSATAQVGALHRVLEHLRASQDPVDATTLIERDRRVLWHPYTPLADPQPPVPVVSAQDEFLVLADGRRIIDAISSWWTILHGHRHPVLMEAMDRAARQVDHVLFAGVTHHWAVELAERMLHTAPWAGGRVFFSDDGSTAVEVALKMAYQYWCHRGEPERTLFVGFEDSYHGDTFGAMAVGRDPVFFGRFEPLLFRAERVPVSAARLEELLSERAGRVAAVIIEPLVQGAGGMRMHSGETLREIYDVVRRHGVLFVADEVMTGGGRLGMVWAHQAAAIAPDLICAGKTIAGGVLPIAATLAAPQIVAAFETADRGKMFFHGHSFTAHPIACAVGVANWQALVPHAPAAARCIEQFWRTRLGALGDAPRVRDLRIRGSIAALELDVPGGYLADVAGRIRRRAVDMGVLLRPLGNVVYAMPPLSSSRDSLERIAEALEASASSILT